VGWNGWKNVEKWEFDQPSFIAPNNDDRTWGPVFLWTEGSRTLINMDGPDLGICKCDEARPGRYTSGSCNKAAGEAMALWARPSSNHGGGVNVAFASGRVLFVRESIDYGVFIAIMTPFDKKSDSPNPNYQLNDSDIR
jgi:hypothetical protein